MNTNLNETYMVVLYKKIMKLRDKLVGPTKEDIQKEFINKYNYEIVIIVYSCLHKTITNIDDNLFIHFKDENNKDILITTREFEILYIDSEIIKMFYSLHFKYNFIDLKIIVKYIIRYNTTHFNLNVGVPPSPVKDILTYL